MFQKFAETLDPRNQSYIDYSNKAMLGTVYYKGIAGLVSMQSMTYEFNDDKVLRNIMSFLGERDEGYLPHVVTVNEYLEKLSTEQLQEIQQSMVYDLIRRKTFDDARFQKKWLLIVDGSQLYSGSRQINEQCFEKHYNKGTNEERVSYHSDVLEAKIVMGEKAIISKQVSLSKTTEKMLCVRKA